MGKSLIFLSLLILIIMFIGASVTPQNSVFWLASTSTIYQSVRAVLSSILILQLMTRPPRHILVRALSGLVGITAAIWVIQQTYSYQMQSFDTLAMLGASVAVIITSLERKADKISIHSSSNKHVRTV